MDKLPNDKEIKESLFFQEAVSSLFNIAIPEKEAKSGDAIHWIKDLVKTRIILEGKRNILTQFLERLASIYFDFRTPPLIFVEIAKFSEEMKLNLQVDKVIFLS